RTHAARGISGGRAQQFAEFIRRARIEAAIGATRQARDLAKSLFGDGIVAFLEHEGGHPEKPERARGVTKIVKLFLHGVADENQGLHLRGLRLALGVGDDLADLGMAATAVDPLHQRAQPLGLRSPGGGPGFAEAGGKKRAPREPRRSPPPRGTCPPAVGTPYPTRVGGSWSRRARR